MRFCRFFRSRLAAIAAITAPFTLIVHHAARADAFAHALAEYRVAPGCQDPARLRVVQLVDHTYTAWHVADPAAPDAVALGRVAAARIDALAAIEAAKGCPALALEHYRFVIASFDGPKFDDLTRYAVRGIRALRH